ncbi:pyruvate:ferredoxin (flavodoxin) oxidoreductase [Nodularia spumigena CS-584]|jgi:pyruvate-ferredoxin/flavodoxin oxidoreductase|uniref:Pyruvate-flavodoxin oxidoreductase n=1 Tax=Nodularia spumigena UHCC 0060 TaxID=3110300 RepID=A0ABU5USM7_NODSP|nr:pyruvate:ferredoxin (flavodoxin) oxidoreductase [Nodularia spumigena]AHJ29189.1 Pyruvate-flavodoxin oxidoreductase [Nodularia spumigena CCY9414]EAW44523.1 ferredoxin (flavodoxin) oxidoreductase [Nodularia spumigena CCY9414]MDB9384498.1 pyruvate:ferredoxin (flavodoxin) oxidoreductase [Nodularia spumigena CS-584]MEA5525115.1 pyruvate:ferredoxin (flavodoxin) oxidoreductase [Nodularia spumigena UHCC 0143]MEA5558854.1 pyruvate:ferredoxin (flavodoxin) oxidoreductase [Nodularia spumigena CH309]
MNKTFATIDGNEAVARVAYKLNEVIAIYPITPSSAMGEWADTWSAANQPNLWNTIPSVVQMQSEGGAAAAVHGALQTGSLSTTFTASQGLLLMIPNLYKIAGELTSAVVHVAARSLATHALSIFGDHSDVMASRATGFALLCSASVQESHDFALISQAATLETRVSFMHFFDGFRTSHEVQKIKLLSDEQLRSLIDENLILAHRDRALTPDRPLLRGTAQNPDVFFQGREAANPYYNATPAIVQRLMDEFAEVTGRHYQIYEYHGASDAERVIILMGSGCETVHETVDYLNTQGEKVGVVKVRLYRPFDVDRFIAVLPNSVQAIAVLDRTKEPGSAGEPLYLDVVAAIHEANPKSKIQNLKSVIGGRYGLSSKEFTPAMVKSIFDHLAQTQPQNHFTVGINDDVTHTSLKFDPNFSTEPDNVIRAMFYGLGSDGTVGANKNSIKIIGEETDNYAQGYFVYDSKKSGSMTVSHLRFGPQPIRSTYLINKANFIGCHHWGFLERIDILKDAISGGTLLLNSPHNADTVWEYLPPKVQQQIIDKQLKFFVINANQVARESGMGGRINTIMQVCFFALAGVLPEAEAITKIKKAIEKTYGKKGAEVVQKNLQAVDNTLTNLHKVDIPQTIQNPKSKIQNPKLLDSAPEFIRDVLGEIMVWHGDDLPVSALPADGTFPTGTAKWEKRNVAEEIPVWEGDVCVQCGKCVMVCPHAAIRAKAYQPDELINAPSSFKYVDAKDKSFSNQKFTIQVAPEDCTGCAICVNICPAKNKSQPSQKAINMAQQLPLREQERQNWDFFLSLPNPDRRLLKVNQIRQQQLQEPLFEFSGACAGCGETPYLKLLTQLFGDRSVIANATGCSSIYGGNLPTTPWTTNAEGRGPAWSNSLFEDNAEFGFGYRLSLDKQAEFAAELLLGSREWGVGSGDISDELVKSILTAEQKSEADIWEQRERVELLKQELDKILTPDPNLKSQIQNLKSLADYLVRKSVWIVGGDGWAYDIDFHGIDHLLASGRNVNILVMDTEVYSNTGGQSSKATPKAAVAKFAASGKPAPKKDLGLMAMTYGNVYVASVALGAKDEHTLKAFLEAEAFDGPSLIIAYSHCIAHGINMTTGMKHQQSLVESGRWLLYRHNPELQNQGKNPLQLDMRSPTQSVEQSMYQENRFKMLTKSKPEVAQHLLEQAQAEVNARWQMYQYLANR